MSVGIRVAGVDGCRGGWVVVGAHEGRVEAVLLPDGHALGALALEVDVLAIDIPIGLSDTGLRRCDLEARRLLGRPRASSVFPAPARALVEAGELGYPEACTMARKLTGKAISRQAYGLLPKIREVDALVRANPELVGLIREVHPEVSFCVWNGMRAMECNKKRPEGRQERLALVERDFPGAYERVRGEHPRSRVASDDILDAFASCWSASRIAAGEHVAMPVPAEHDRRGLPMEIVA